MAAEVWLDGIEARSEEMSRQISQPLATTPCLTGYAPKGPQKKSGSLNLGRGRPMNILAAWVMAFENKTAAVASKRRVRQRGSMAQMTTAVMSSEVKEPNC